MWGWLRRLFEQRDQPPPSKIHDAESPVSPPAVEQPGAAPSAELAPTAAPEPPGPPPTIEQPEPTRSAGLRLSAPAQAELPAEAEAHAPEPTAERPSAPPPPRRYVPSAAFSVRGKKRVLFLDTETTGLGRFDRIVTIAGIVLVGEQIQQDEQFHLVFDPRRNCHPEAAAIHGWDDWTLRHQDIFEDHAHDIYARIASADLLVMHNDSFDIAFIERELSRSAMPSIYSRRRLCTMRWAREVWPYQRASLDACLERIGLSREGPRHGAHEDALLTINLYLALHGSEVRYRGTNWRKPSNYREPPPIPEGPWPRRRPKKARRDPNATGA